MGIKMGIPMGGRKKSAEDPTIFCHTTIHDGGTLSCDNRKWVKCLWKMEMSMEDGNVYGRWKCLWKMIIHNNRNHNSGMNCCPEITENFSFKFTLHKFILFIFTHIINTAKMYCKTDARNILMLTVTAYTIYVILNICSCTHLFYFQIWIR